MKKFLAGLIMASDDRASMAKTLTWFTYVAFIVSWFMFPDRNNTDLIAVFTILLGYTLTGKLSFQKHNKPFGQKSEGE